MTRSDARWTLVGLGAEGPFKDQEDKLSLFGQFVGDWVGDAVFIKEDGTEIPGGRGAVHFAWILGGRAIQDVWMVEDPKTKEMNAGGTTLRFYDPEADRWQSTWVSPRQNTTMTFTGMEVGGEIVLEAVNKRGRLEHWVFYDVERGKSFRWRGESSSDGGKSWKTYARYRFQKAPDSKKLGKVVSSAWHPVLIMLVGRTPDVRWRVRFICCQLG